MSKKVISVLLAMAMAASLSACGSSSSTTTTAAAGDTEAAATEAGSEAATEAAAASGDTITIKLCHTDPSGCATTEALQKFAADVTEKSGGRLTIEEYADGVMGDDDVINEQIFNGAYMMNYSDPGLLEPYYADYSILFSPYFYESPEEIQEFAQTDFAKKLQSECHDAGLMVIDGMQSYYGSRQIMSNKAINSPDDLKGLNFRMPNNATQLELAEAWGANPVTISFSETYSALQQGVVDCVENPIGSLYANSIQEVCSYINITNHFYAVNGLVMNSAIYDALDPELQQILTDCAADFVQYNTEMVEAEEEECLQKMEEAGCTINRDVDIDAMKEAALKVLDVHDYRDGLVEEAQAAMAEVRGN